MLSLFYLLIFYFVFVFLMHKDDDVGDGDDIMEVIMCCTLCFLFFLNLFSFTLYKLVSVRVSPSFLPLKEYRNRRAT